MSFLDKYGLGVRRAAENLPQQEFMPPTPPSSRGGFDSPFPVTPPPPLKIPEPPAAFPSLGQSDRREEQSPVQQAVAHADEVLRRLRDFDVPFPREEAPANRPMRRNAFTPTEGPDTGAENPNSDATPAGYFRALRGAESTNDPGATNKVTGAAGLYQIQPRTFAWLAKVRPDLGLDPAKIYDPEQQDKGVRAYTDISMRQLVPTLGRMPTAGELYALHFLGHSGGMQFLGGLDRPAKDVIRAADFKANPWLYAYADKPASALLNRFNSMMGSR